MIESLTGTYSDWTVAIVRIVLGLVFFGHGAQKALGWYGGPGLVRSMRTFTEELHLPTILAFLVIAGEFLGGIGLIVGLLSRLAALVIALTMVGAIATVHFRFGLFLNWFADPLLGVHVERTHRYSKPLPILHSQKAPTHDRGLRVSDVSNATRFFAPLCEECELR